MSKQRCPMTFNNSAQEVCDGWFDCVEGQCAWWIPVLNTQQNWEHGCAVAMLAKKNAQGLIQL